MVNELEIHIRMFKHCLFIHAGEYDGRQDMKVFHTIILKLINQFFQFDDTRKRVRPRDWPPTWVPPEVKYNIHHHGTPKCQNTSPAFSSLEFDCSNNEFLLGDPWVLLCSISLLIRTIVFSNHSSNASTLSDWSHSNPWEYLEPTGVISN